MWMICWLYIKWNIILLIEHLILLGVFYLAQLLVLTVAAARQEIITHRANKKCKCDVTSPDKLIQLRL
jgi:hypothetical protein